MGKLRVFHVRAILQCGAQTSAQDGPVSLTQGEKWKERFVTIMLC